MYDDDDLQRLYGKKYFSHRTRPEMWNRRAQFVLEKFNPKTALDIGCASGEFVKSMIDVNIDAYGIDGSDFAISNSNESIKNKILKVNLNSDPFPFENNTFDFIGSFYSVEHIHDIEFFSKELFRTLKSSGKAWFLTPNIGEEGRTKVDVFTNTFENWKFIFEKQNFTVTKFSPHEMMALRGKLGAFHFYTFPKTLQNIVKRLAYDYANKTMNDTSFILQKC